MDYKITCKQCGGKVFTLQLTPYSRLYFTKCGCGELMLIGGHDVMDPTIDDLELRRRSILFRRFE